MEVATIPLATRWQHLKSELPNLRIRDAADKLGVSEAELLATGLGSTVSRLDSNAASLLHALPEVGRCMALTRNAHVVSEVRGVYGGVELGGHVGQVVGTDIDLRVFPAHWKHVFAVNEPHPQREGERRRSLHVFDATGTAVHKVYLEPEGDAATWDAIVGTRRKDLPLVVEPAPSPRAERPDTEVDVDAFLAAWDAMQDTHEFFPLLAKHHVSRAQALRLAGPSRAKRVANDSTSKILDGAAASRDKIMIFVGNRGCIQIFSGTVNKIVRMGPWLNVLDPSFNLHLREDNIASSWVVSKPTKSGIVTSLELFDANGDNIALVFRKRDDREKAEDPSWSALLSHLEAV